MALVDAGKKVNTTSHKTNSKAKEGGAAKAKRLPAKEGKAAAAAAKGSALVNGDNMTTTANGAGTVSGSSKVDTDQKVAAVTSAAAPAKSADPETSQCKHCKKTVPTATHPAHSKACLKEKKERLRKKREAKEAAQREKDAKEAKDKDKEKEADKDNDKDKDKDAPGEVDYKPPAEDAAAVDLRTEKPKPTKKNAGKAAAGAAEEGNKKTTKKRKADGDVEKAPKPKKKKEEPKPKLPKPKGPIDVEKHCGVILANGAQCARSLTCKSHSMGSKRAVLGRSLPYDMLLHAYQKKNQAKQQRAAIDANAPLQDEHDPNGAPIDSDEEKDAVMAAIARSRPQPLVRHVAVPTRRLYQYVRMKETLSNALGGIRGQGLFAVGDAGRRTSTTAMDTDVIL